MKSKSLPFIFFFAFIIFFTNCKKEQENFGVPYKIFSLIELNNGTEIDRTNQILECRLDDSFFFLEDMEMRIEMNSGKCFLDPNEFVGGVWNKVEVDSTSTELLSIQIPYGFILHDSLILSQTFSQFSNNEMQIYQIIEFNEEKIRFQSNGLLTEPNTQNVWQIEMRRDQ